MKPTSILPPGVKDALEQLGVEVRVLDRTNPLDMVAHLMGMSPNLDGLWNTALGSNGEDGTIAGFIRALFPDLPYVGSGVLGGALPMDKELSQDAFRAAGYPGPDGLCYFLDTDGTFRASKPEGKRYLSAARRPTYDALRARLGSRLVLKPNNSGASLGLHVVDDARSFDAALESIAARFHSVLIEAYLSGTEFAVCVLETYAEPLPICQVNKTALHDTQDKLAPNFSLPAPISDELAHELRLAARELHERLGCHGFSRLDLIVDRAGHIRPLEVNSNPGLIPGQSSFPAAWAALGLEYRDLIARILETAFLPRRREGVRRPGRSEVPPFPNELKELLPRRSASTADRPAAFPKEPAPAISLAKYRC